MAINIPAPGLRNDLKKLKNPAFKRPPSSSLTVGDWAFEDQDGDLVVVNTVTGATLVIARGDTRS